MVWVPSNLEVKSNEDTEYYRSRLLLLLPIFTNAILLLIKMDERYMFLLRYSSDIYVMYLLPVNKYRSYDVIFLFSDSNNISKIQYCKYLPYLSFWYTPNIIKIMDKQASKQTDG